MKIHWVKSEGKFREGLFALLLESKCIIPQHINLFTNQEVLLNLCSKVYIGTPWVDLLDQITVHGTKFNLQNTSSPQRLGCPKVSIL